MSDVAIESGSLNTKCLTHKVSPSSLESLPPEARNHIIEFLPPKDALVVSGASSLWHEHVRHCGALWAGTLQRRFPISFERIQAELAAAKALRGGYLAYGEGVDYVQALSRLWKERYRSFDSHPEVLLCVEKRRGCFSVFRSMFKKTVQYRILILGLDDAGKTSLYNFIVDGTMGSTFRTIGFNVNIATYGDMSLCCWDIGGNDTIRKLWRHYYQDTDAIIYVIDSKDESRLSESSQALASFILPHEEVGMVPILFLATKQDLSDTMTIEQVAGELKTRLVEDGRRWRVQGCSAKNGKGVHKGLDWLKEAIESNKVTKTKS